MRRITLLGAASAGLAVMALSACGSGKKEAATPIVPPAAAADVATTAYGKLRGAQQDGVVVFKGIPYGASTTGKNRFMPPQPPAAWEGVRDALTPGDQCPQTPPPATAAY